MEKKMGNGLFGITMDKRRKWEIIKMAKAMESGHTGMIMVVK